MSKKNKLINNFEHSSRIYFKEIGKFTSLSKEEEFSLWEKYKKFNLGGMTNPNLNNNKYDGLNEFKLSFDATCIEYIGDLELITNQKLYNLYRNSKPIRYILKRDK